MSLLSSLGDDEVPDLPPHIPLASLSTSRLRQIIVDASRRTLVHSFLASSPDPPRAFTPTDVLTDLPPDANAAVMPELLPGLEHVLLEHQGKIELWSVLEQRMLFRSPTEGEADYCATFAFDLLPSRRMSEPKPDLQEDETREAELLFAVLFVREDASAYVRVFSYRFTETAGEVILHRNLAVNFLWRPIMSGTLLMLHNASLLNIVLINCGTQEVATIDFAPITVRMPLWFGV